jgi:hypothetical protein
MNTYFGRHVASKFRVEKWAQQSICFMTFPVLAYCLSLKMEETCFSETSVDFQRVIQCYIAEGRPFNTGRYVGHFLSYFIHLNPAILHSALKYQASWDNWVRITTRLQARRPGTGLRFPKVARHFSKCKDNFCGLPSLLWNGSRGGCFPGDKATGREADH